MSRQARAADRLVRWRLDPIAMVLEEFGVTPDAWQADVLTAFANPAIQRIAMKACKGPGKTAVEAWCILNFLATRPSPKIIATSITEGNLHTNLWPELAKWIGRSPFFTAAFEWTKTRVSYRADPNNWFAVARSWPKTADPEKQADSLAGVHADHVMAVGDESGGYPQAVMTTLEAVLSSCVEGKVIQGGNPTHTTGPLHRACTIDRALWHVVTITGDPDSPKRSSRISLEWARQQIKSYGRDNPWVMVNVLGEFPPASINSLLGVEEVQRAMGLHLSIDRYEWAEKRIGVDVARFGDDRTVLFPRQGRAGFRPQVLRGLRTTAIAGRVMMGAAAWWGNDPEPGLIFVDDTGHWGHGVIDALADRRVPHEAVVYHARALDPRYKNRRAEMWIQGSKAIKNGAALPPIDELIGELTEPTYTFVNGVFQLEDKDLIKARLGRSPDLADAYMQTYALPDKPNNVHDRLGTRPALRHEFDPYATPRDEREAPVGGHVSHDFDPLR